REKSGLLQHVLQRAGVSWCYRWFGDDCDTAFALGFATDLVIDLLGQNNARSGGSGKSHSTDAHGGFIAGAPGRGGMLGTLDADTGWRRTLGQDWFVAVLRQAQKAGDKEAHDKDKLGHFVVHDRSEAKRLLLTAPFLGKLAFERELVGEAFV